MGGKNKQVWRRGRTWQALGVVKLLKSVGRAFALHV